MAKLKNIFAEKAKGINLERGGDRNVTPIKHFDFQLTINTNY